MLEKASSSGYDTKLIEFRPNYQQIDLIFQKDIAAEMKAQFLLNCHEWEPDQRAVLKAPYRTSGWDKVDSFDGIFEDEQKIARDFSSSPPFDGGSHGFVESCPPFVGDQFVGDDVSVCSVDSGSSESSFMYESLDRFHAFQSELYPIRERSYLKPL
eukprot:TRINITY_DN129_c0_g1_i1.p1 TRINITY_DN129_c0_g1~~TRINITY_DN129_c0_g1_i1.p1  ORF type:complete len:156 (-),score=41.36 TRINITY_DN129_c0_g1_i1:140-607(-)